ncbi:MAG: RNA methyltransferase [Candidatus Pacebacteria bacterium]|nr:RNA methyltransferase [Candidatus Paceibacterota bacterium]
MKDFFAVVNKGDRSLPLLNEYLPLTVVLDRLRSAFNVGNIFRLADAVRAERVITCGYTASPPHPKLAKTARGCDMLVPSSYHQDATEAIAQLKDEGYRTYAVETVAGAPPVWSWKPRFPAAVLLGNEALGITKEALTHCDECVQVPCYGVKNSINVANCAAVVLYAALREWLETRERYQEIVRHNDDRYTNGQ